MTEVTMIRGQHLNESELHRRSSWGDLQALADSIAQHGIQIPMVVRKRKAGGYEISKGVRRFRAGTKAGLKTFPCIVAELDDEDMIVHQIIENKDREGLHPMDEAMLCHDLSMIKGMTHDSIAKKFGFKRGHVVRRLKLMTLAPKLVKAFVAGRFDETAALALASTGDVAKQLDILAALDAQTLQPEEIASYVQRTFTAQLDDVPWRMSDEKLVPAAGPCTTCPKRSDAQRDLFGDDKRGLRCLDVDCWRSKMEASWQRELKRPEVSVLDQPADTLFLPNGDGRPVVTRSSGMVDADSQCQHLAGRTWREAVFAAVPEGSDGPTVYVARDQDGRARYLLREASVTKLVKKSAPVEERQEAAQIADPTPRAEGKIRRTLIQQLAATVAKRGGDTEAWIAARVLDSATVRTLSQTAQTFDHAIKALDIEGLDDKPGLLALADQSPNYALQIATVALLYDTADVVGDIGPAVQELAKIVECDLDAIELELRSKA